MSSIPAFNLDITRGEPGSAREVGIVVSGELDSASSPALLAAFHEVASAGANGLTLDLAGLDFIDSAGLRSLIEIDHEAGRREVALVVVPPP